MLKSKCVRFLFGYIGQDTEWTLANGFQTPELFFSDKIHLMEKVISKLFISIPKNIEVFYDAGNINYYQLTKKWLFLLWLGNHDVPPLPVSYIFFFFYDNDIHKTLILNNKKLKEIKNKV